MAVKAVASLTVLGPKSYLGSFAQVLSQYYEVDQCLRVTAVLWGGDKNAQKMIKVTWKVTTKVNWTSGH